MAKFRIETNDQIARGLYHSAESRSRLNALGQLVGINYRRIAREEFLKNRVNSPFAAKNQQSILDPSSFNVAFRGAEMIISVNAPAAEFAEVGNGPGDIQGKPNLAIQIKPSAVKRTKGKKRGVKLSLASGTKISKFNGKYYLVTKRVRSAPGHHFLRRAIELVFK